MGELGITEEEGLREFVLRPPERLADDPTQASAHAPRHPVRVVGPGRFERGYLARLSAQANELEIARERERELSDHLREGKAALEMSQRVEHGCQRRIDRLEVRLEERTQALLDSERQHKRLALALGAMQHENEMLRAQLPLSLAGGSTRELSSAGSGRAPARPLVGLWRRIFQRTR